jgi:molecular chaperone GrpE
MFRNIKQIVKILNIQERVVIITEHKETAKELAGEKHAELPKAEERKQIGHAEGKKLPDPNRVKELEEKLARLQAEFENYKKRAARENEMLREKAAADAMLKLLPVVDDFDMAIAHMDKSAHKEFRHGIELIYVKLLDTLKREGVEEMKCLGQSFDPYKHDALRATVGEEGRIVEIIQKGYTLRGNVLRHAKVAVGKGKEAKEDGKQG